MAAYLYQWTHLPTGKYYIGSRTEKNCHINDGYICSSDLIKEEIIKNKNEWSRKILAEGNSKDILNLEKQLLNHKDVINDKNSLNQTNYKGKIVFKSLKDGERTIPLKNRFLEIPSIHIKKPK